VEITSFFAHPSFWGIGLAIILGFVWLFPLSPLGLRRLSTWGVFIGAAVIFAPSIVYIQIPWQNLTGNWLEGKLGLETYSRQIYITAIPVILISGLVQEGAKLVPTVIYWLTQKRNINPILGLSLGAMAGAGIGIFEAQWIHNMIIANGWNWGVVQSAGFIAVAGFIERIFSVCFHMAIGALAGWGLAKRWGWQFYLIASFAHGLTNYSAVLAQTRKWNVIEVEIFIAVCALLVYGMAFWIRWRKNTADETADGKL
jgi:hypothetical protein